ncbi:ATPase [Shewanella algae]|uniref:ATP-binding protein n=1 Tax=Shewanella algae TaxID=38313 RepID=UPI00118422AD|nr:ATP-binding protein [Shewanella algae]TVL55340.1 ATPase [Shewanella algae]
MLQSNTSSVERLTSTTLTSLLQDLSSALSPAIAQLTHPVLSLRLMKVIEINDEKSSSYRQALANVYATLKHDEGLQYLYILDCGLDGVSLYLGVCQLQPQADTHEALKNLRGALEGQLPGINLCNETPAETVVEHLKLSRYQGVVLGIPTKQAEEQGQQEEDFQGIERLVRTLTSGGRDGVQSADRWQMIAVAKPLSRDEARTFLDTAYQLASEVSLLVKTNIQSGSNSGEQKGINISEGTSEGTNSSQSDTKGKNEGASETKTYGKNAGTNLDSSSSGTNSSTAQAKNYGTNSSLAKTTGSSFSSNKNESNSVNHSTGHSLNLTKEFTDKRAQHLLEHIEKALIPRLQKGYTKGLFSSAIYLAAQTPSTYQRLKNSICATYQGQESTVTPLEVLDLNVVSPEQMLQLPTLTETLNPKKAIFNSFNGHDSYAFGNLLTTDELALVAGLPSRELPGLRRRKTVDFIVDLPRIRDSDALKMGQVIDRGRHQHANSVRLNKSDFNKHIFVTGVTGAGKTTTCLSLLVASELPFLVIEPAKTEYRALHQHMPGKVDFYRPNGDEHICFRLNPFALIHAKQKIKSHASFLRNVFAAVFPMEASMPYLIEQAILRAYEEKGWDLSDNSCLLGDDPFEPRLRAWPTMGDMIRQLDILIPEQGMGKEFEEKYRGSLVSRLTSLTHGVLGDILNVPQSIDVIALLDRKVVIELEEIKDGEGKALMMALLLGSVSEAIRYRHSQQTNFRHLTLVEEAHRLLSRPEPGDKARAMAVEAFSDLLAEVRKYGEGLIIADQIPAKLVPDVIKNTHTKIVHRLFAEDDRRTMGEAMMMNDKQRDFLPNLGTGEAVIFCGGWHGPVHAAIRDDLAQTDGATISENEISKLAVELLWRERARYYPALHQLGWMGQDKHKFADFVQSSRKAVRLLLALNPKAQTVAKSISPVQQQKKAKALKQWFERWQREAIIQPVADEDWQVWSACDKPGKPLTAIMLALLQDINLTARTEAKHTFTWPFLHGDLTLWGATFDLLFEQMIQCETDDLIVKLNVQLNQVENRNCGHIFAELANYQ